MRPVSMARARPMETDWGASVLEQGPMSEGKRLCEARRSNGYKDVAISTVASAGPTFQESVCVCVYY